MHLAQFGERLAAERYLVHRGLVGIGPAAFGDDHLMMIERIGGHEGIFIAVEHAFIGDAEAEHPDVKILHALKVLHPDPDMRKRHFR